MKRALCLCAALLALIGCAMAEPVLPPEALILEEETIGPIRRVNLEIPSTGEHMVLLVDGDGDSLALVTTSPGTPAPDADGATLTAVQAACPGAIVLREEGPRVTVASPDWYGTLELRSGCVVARELRGGYFVNADGLLSLDGAICDVRLLRPQAEILEMEFDADDREYEGEALADGELYGFEIDAATGRLLEWERD